MKFIVFLLMFLLSGFVFAQEEEDDDADDSGVLQYVGVKDCRRCHKKVEQGEQFKIWSESAHAKAFETLKSEEAAKIAKEKGLTVAAHEAKECLQCHATGYDAEPAMLGKKFSVEEGVQCETCHGAGSKYKKKKIMKSRELSLENGMTAIFVDDGSAKKQCLECHNEKSPTYKEFNFEESWEKIAHPVPKDKKD